MNHQLAYFNYLVLLLNSLEKGVIELLEFIGLQELIADQPLRHKNGGQ